MSRQSHLIINSQDVHNVNPDVDDVDLAREGKIKLVVISGQTKMLGERDILVTENLLLGSVGAGEAAGLKLVFILLFAELVVVVSLVHSHWSRNVEGRLSLVESFPSDACASSLVP